MEDARMVAVRANGSEARDIGLSNSWTTWAALPPRRAADVGAPVRATIVAMSVVEARAANEQARLAASGRLAATLPGVRHALVEECEAVDALLAWAESAEYFNAWVLVETTNID
jgi:hypothetical protein